jgi:WD40 repeat protein
MPDDPGPASLSLGFPGERAGRPWFLLALAFLVGCDGPPPVIGPEGSLTGHSREIVALAFAPDGKTLASRSSGEVKVWDLSARKELGTFPSDGADFGSLAFSPDGKTLAVNRAGVGAVVRDLASGQERAVFRDAPDRPVPGAPAVSYGWGLAYSPDGKTLAGGGSRGSEDGFVTLWETSTGEPRLGAKYPSPVTTVAYGPDGKTLAVGSMGGTVDLFDPASGRDKVAISASRAYLAPVAFSPDGRTLATASDERRIKLWDATTGRELGTLKGHLKGLFCVAFHPGGRVVASGDAGGLIYLWDVRRRRPIARLEGHRGKVWAVAFGPDAAMMASAGEDREIRLWDVSAMVKGVGP